MTVAIKEFWIIDGSLQLLFELLVYLSGLLPVLLLPPLLLLLTGVKVQGHATGEHVQAGVVNGRTHLTSKPS